MEKLEFSGKNISEALKSAAKHFGVDETYIHYNLVSNSSSSGNFLSRLFFREIKIEAWVEKKEEDLKAAAREAVRQVLHKNSNTNSDSNKKIREAKVNHKEAEQNKIPKSDVNFHNKEFEQFLKDFCKNFFAAFDITDDSVAFNILENGDAEILINNENFEHQLSKSDKLSLAFEHVFKRLAQKKFDDFSARINIKAGASSEKHKERLHAMALSLAEKVKKSKRSITLSSKSSSERRIIHLALDTVSGVKTKSVGNGDKRKLIIYCEEQPLKRKLPEKKVNPPQKNIQRRNNKPPIEDKSEKS